MTAKRSPTSQVHTSQESPARRNGRALPTKSPVETEIRMAGAGASLVSEAKGLMRRHKWKDALRVLESAGRLRPSDGQILELRAVAGSHARQSDVASQALSALARRAESRASTWATVAEVALAKHRYEPADAAARQALKVDAGFPDGWYDLAAAYAGRGWFDEAEACLDQVEAISHLPSSGLGEWRVGRAVNRWAISRTVAPLVAVVAFLLFGLLGLAVGLSTPMIVREYRIRHLDSRFTALATDAWQSEHTFRLVNAALVAAAIIGWFVLLTLGGSIG